jgi:hypothetical protein
MAKSAATPKASQPAKENSDWYTFLRSAFLNGLKAYGASLMVVAPEPPLSLPKGPSHLEILETSMEGPKPAARKHPLVTPQASPALPHTTVPKPAWSRA